MPSPIAIETMGIAVAIDRPRAVKNACHGLRSRLRRAMRKAGDASRCNPRRSRTDGLNAAGGSGRIASAGGSRIA